MPKLMTKKQADGWAKIHARGRWAFIMIYGVLCWGVFSGVLMAIFMSFSPDRTFLGALKTYLPFFMVGGVFWGFLMWVFAESRYRIYLINQDDPS